MSAQVDIVVSKGRIRVRVETARGWVDWPIHAGDHILYDAPERISTYLKIKTETVFRFLDRYYHEL